MATQFHSDHHFVPCVYLKGFADSGKRVWTSRLYVPHANVPEWKQRSIQGIGYLTHLYTRITAAGETDEVEIWLDREFKSPAEEALQRAISDQSLTPDHWKHLIRFLAAQDVRTPARLKEDLQRWEKNLPSLMIEVLQESAEKLKLNQIAEIPNRQFYYDYFPSRVVKELDSDNKTSLLRSEIVAGRGLWLFSIRDVLTRSLPVLLQQRWTILVPPNGLSWFTSDDPVTKLNFCNDGTYDFGGGWGRQGTEIFLALSPRHLLYTKVGERHPPKRGSRMSILDARMVRRFIAEHAHRMIFSASPDAQISELRPRAVDPAHVQSEREQWLKWHKEQSDVERRLRGWKQTEAS